MSRNLTASDRSSLIRLASSLPVGSPERKAILAGLSKVSTGQIRPMTREERRSNPGVYPWEDETGMSRDPLIAEIKLSKEAGYKLLREIPIWSPDEHPTTLGFARILGGQTAIFINLFEDGREDQPIDLLYEEELSVEEALLLMKKVVRDVSRGNIPLGFIRTN